MNPRYKIPSILVLCLFLAIGLSSCGKEPCDGIDCGTGECFEGACICDSLYEGFNCGVLVTEKYKGAWTAGDICGASSSVYSVDITDGGDIGQIVISSYGPDRLPVIVEARATDLRIPTQAYGQAVISGSGGLADTDDVITLDYLVDYGGGSSTNCLTTLEKQ